MRNFSDFKVFFIEHQRAWQKYYINLDFTKLKTNGVAQSQFQYGGEFWKNSGQFFKKYSDSVENYSNHARLFPFTF